MSVVGALLAGGQSQRMGRPKAGLPRPDAKTFSSHLLEVLGFVATTRVIVGHASGISVSEGITRIEDLRENCGPLSGVAALLASGLGDVYLVVPCDMPLLHPTLLKRLLVPAPSSVVFANGDHSFYPLPCALRPNCEKIAAVHLDGPDRSLMHFLKATRPLILPLDEHERGRFRACNTPEEYAALYSAMRSGPE
jgi:molybdopterin-guanine dinucleotide biosynthesis protein A